MKLSVFFLLAAILSVSAKSFGQKVTLNTRNASLESVLQSLRQQTGFDYVADEQLLDNAKTVTIKVNNLELNDALAKIFVNQSLIFSVDNKAIIIRQKETSFFDKVKEAFAAMDVFGRVTDEANQPLFGATVSVKGSSNAVTTDANGFFTLKNVQPSAIIVITYIGFDKKEVPVAANLGQIKLSLATSKLDEIMVVAYGTTTRRLSTGSVGHVSGVELDKQPISNPIIGLEGRVAGAFITQTAGFAGAPVNVVIRGQNSLQALTNNITAPLYIVDGVPFSSTPVEQSIGGFGITAFSPLNTLDPTQIESIDVLKDADATAIYGSRGANGVVLITTKKGKAGNTQVSLDLSSGFGEVTNMVKMANTDQFLAIRRQAFANDNVTPTVANAPDLMLWDQHAYTDMPKLLMGKTQHQSKATFGISGGDQFTQFIFGGNYRYESSVMPTNTADKGLQFHTSTQHRSRDGKFGINLSVSYNADNNSVPSYNINGSNYSLAPNYPLYNADGSLYWGGGATNPLAAFQAIYTLKSTNLVTNASMHYMVLPGLNLKVDAGYNYDNVFATTITPSTAVNPAFNPVPQTTMSNNYVKTYIAEPQINYTHTWGKSRLTALVGGTWQETQLIQPYFVIGSYTNVQLATSLTALNIIAKSSNSSDYKYVSGFGRVEYEWDGKYLFSGNIRRDGSSRFGSNNPYGNFGSGALAWIFSKESFVKDNLKWLSFGKLKMSYGLVGNDKTLTDYAYLSQYFAGTAYGPYASITPSRIANPYLQWESTKKLDAALELGFLKDRILFTAGVYRNRTSHLLANITIPSQDGFQSYSGNLPDGAIVQNQGLEFELSTSNIKNKDFSWSSSFNLTAPQNKLLSFPNIASTSYAGTLIVGQSLNVRTVYHSTGIVNGIATAQDVNGDGVITSGLAAYGAGDRIVYGNNDPKFYGGFSNTFRYKGFTLDFLLQFIKRTSTRGDQNFVSIPGTATNLPLSYLDVPVKYTATAGTPAYNAFSYYQGSDAAVEDASFIRLKNVSLAYNVPVAWAKNLKMSALQIYLHGQNLLTFTKYKGLDPETLSNQLPPLRMMVAGIKATF